MEKESRKLQARKSASGFECSAHVFLITAWRSFPSRAGEWGRGLSEVWHLEEMANSWGSTGCREQSDCAPVLHLCFLLCTAPRLEGSRRFTDRSRHSWEFVLSSNQGSAMMSFWCVCVYVCVSSNKLCPLCPANEAVSEEGKTPQTYVSHCVFKGLMNGCSYTRKFRILFFAVPVKIQITG